jgi:hypothetical protein
MIDDIERGSFFLHRFKSIHEAEYILGIIEIPGSYILDLDNYSIELLQQLKAELDVVGQRRKLSVARRENRMEIATLAENLVHISSLFRIPAVLSTETADPAFKQGLVKLIF